MLPHQRSIKNRSKFTVAPAAAAPAKKEKTGGILVWRWKRGFLTLCFIKLGRASNIYDSSEFSGSRAVSVLIFGINDRSGWSLIGQRD